MTEEGKIYNASTKRYLKMASHYRYMLMTEEGHTKTISLKTLYKELYNKVFCEDTIENIAEDEEWKEIEGTEGNYFVSNYGRVKSYCSYKAIIVKPFMTQNGYYKVQIFKNKTRQNKYIHTLVANAFEECGKQIDNKYQVHHISNNRQDNRSKNLKWLSAEEHKKIHYSKERKQ